jgi:SulP family sulfate permease
MVCLERLENFLREMQEQNVIVLLCGVRDDFARALQSLRFFDWFPASGIFLEAENWSSTLEAVRYAYDQLGDDLCPECPRRLSKAEGREWYYMI